MLHTTIVTRLTRSLAPILLATSLVGYAAAQALPVENIQLRGDRFRGLHYREMTEEQRALLYNVVNSARAVTNTTGNGPFNTLLRSPAVGELSQNELAALRNKHIGFVFQSFNLLARTGAQANVELPLLYAGVSGSERSRRSREALERVELGDRMRHTPNQLSGGQQQRVAIARALVTNPSIVLADEPTGNLDSRSGVEVMAMLQELNDQGITVVIVTHDANVARHSQRIVELRDGAIVRDEAVHDRVIASEELIQLGMNTAAGAADLFTDAGDTK